MKFIFVVVCAVFIPWGVDSLYCFFLNNLLTCSLACKSNDEVDTNTNSKPCDPSEIDMSSCKLLNLDLDEGRKFEKISVITARNNYIRQIYANTFQGFNFVEKLYLSENLLIIIHPDAFSHLKNLVLLDLRKNFLISFNPNLFMIKNSLQLDLYIGNNYHLPENIIETCQNSYESETQDKIFLLKNQYPSVVLRNQLSTLKLAKLDISNNDLLYLLEDTFKNQSFLSNINIQRNKLTYLPDALFANLGNLVNLNMQHNYITTLTSEIFSNNRKLSNINLSYNRLEVIDEFAFINLTQLNKLNLKHNNLRNINTNWFIFTNYLKHVDMSENYFYQMPVDTFRRNSFLEILRLDDNLFTTLENDFFKNLRSARMISLNSLKLTYLKSNSFNDCQNLIAINLMGNDLTAINENWFMSTNGIRQIILSKNKIKKIPKTFFANIPNLRDIRLEHNYIEDIKDIFGQNNKLKYLNASHNIIRIVSTNTFKTNVALIHIDLSNNYISVISQYTFFTQLLLKNLNLAGNYIKILPDLSNNHKLEVLDLSNNQITQISTTLYQNTNLRTLFVSDNMLTEIPIDIFDKAPKLTRLNFNKNYIKFFNISQLNLLTESREIMASCNNFTIIDNITFPLALYTTAKVYLHGNPINCNCLDLTLNVNKERFLDGTIPNCITPPINKCEDNLTGELINEWKQRISLSPFVCDSNLWKKYDFGAYGIYEEYQHILN